MEASACPLCGAHADRELYRHRGRIVQCRGCGLARRDPMPSRDELLAIYRSDDYFKLTRSDAIGYGDYFADEPVYRPYFARKYRLLRRFASPPGRLLEVGSAAGYALDEARRAGWDVEGLELSPGGVAFARDTLGLPVREGGIDDVDASGEYEVFAAFQTIEHFTDVRAAVRTIARALRPGGVTLLTTPDHGSLVRKLMRRFWISYRPEHLVYFDRKTLPRLLEQEGFEVLHVAGDDPLIVPLPRLVERAVHFYRPGAQPPRNVPNVRLAAWLGDMVVIARRT